MGIKRKIFNLVIDSIIKVFQLNKASKISSGIAEKINPIFVVKNKGEEYLLACSNEVTRWRADTYFTKEPETIDWIDTFKRGETLFDVGANVGLYSIYAAKKGIDVIAFEPESQNYALLNKNVYLNKLQDKITCLNIAISDKKDLDYLYLPKFYSGCAMNTFGAQMDEHGNAFDPAFKQGVMSYSLDLFLAEFKDKFPTHIKIDVDGLEPNIIQGAQNTLADKRVKSLSLELNEYLSEHMEMIDVLKKKGFTLLHKKHAAMFDNTKFKDFYNYLFVRQ